MRLVGEESGRMSEYIITDEQIAENQRLQGRKLLVMPVIVRCKDCKNFTPKGTHDFDNGFTNADYCKFVRGWMLQITPDGFCAWGERKEGGDAR